MQPRYGAATYYPYDYANGATCMSDSLDMHRVIRVLRKRWLMVLLMVVLGLCAGAYYVVKTEKVFRATGLVELSVRRPRILTQQAAIIEDQAALSEEVFNTRLERFKGRTVMLAALERTERDFPQAFADSRVTSGGDPAAALEKRLQRYRSSISLRLLRHSRLIRVEFDHRSPAIAAAACNAFCAAAIASAFDENRVNSDAAVAWLETQAESHRKELVSADDALLRFRQANKMDALQSQQKTVEDALIEINKALVDVESREAMDRDILTTVERVDLTPENVGQLPSSIPRVDEIRDACEKWLSAIAERDSLLIKYTPKHPEVQAKERLVALYRGQATEALGRTRATAQSNRELLARQAASLREMKASKSQQAVDLETQAVETRMRLTTLERARDAADLGYRALLTRIQEARMAADENTATVKLVERANAPRQPVKPQADRIAALSTILGLLAGIGLALLTDRVEDHVASPEDLETAGLPILGVIPHVRTEDRPAIATACLNRRFSEIAEAFAGLRAMLDSPQHRDHARVVLVASSVPGEGKTVTSCNLALAWARKGRRVLLIDCDLRRSRLSAIFPMPPGQKGLLEALHEGSGRSSETLRYPVDGCAGLDVIATRPVDGASPAEVVGTVAMAELIAWAKANYDHVVLDAPPLGLVSDALALAPLANSVLVVARPDVSRKRLVRHTLRRFHESGVHPAGLVMNDVNFVSTSYGYYCHEYRGTYAMPAPEVVPATQASEGRSNAS